MRLPRGSGRPARQIAVLVVTGAVTRAGEAGVRDSDGAAQVRAGGGDGRDSVAFAHDADALHIARNARAGRKLLGLAYGETGRLAVSDARLEKQPVRQGRQDGRAEEAHAGQPGEHAPAGRIPLLGHRPLIPIADFMVPVGRAPAGSSGSDQKTWYLASSMLRK